MDSGDFMIRRSPLFSLPTLAILIALVGSRDANAQQPTIRQMVNSVSSDSMMRTIRSLQSFGTRYEYSPKRDSAASHLLSEFKSLGLQAESDWYSFGLKDYNDVAVIDNQHAVLVGTDSLILLTTDGGTTWRRPRLPLLSQAVYRWNAVHFVNAQQGWVVGSGGMIIHTSDGGDSWTEQFTIVSNDFNDVSFANERCGVIVGYNGVVLRTTNGGTTWKWTVPTSLTLREVNAVDSLNIWASGASRLIIRSTDGGLTWLTQTVDTLNPNFSFALSMVNARIGWAAGYYRYMWKTTNGGMKWELMNSPWIGRGYYTGICFVDDMRGWLLDNSGFIFGTSDGGATWQVAYTSPNGGWGYSLDCIRASRDGRVTVCGSMGYLLTSSDNGKTWIEQITNVPQELLHQTRNIVATLPGSVTPDKEVVIVGHYDCSSTNPLLFAPGANDNASGTSAVLEAARVFKGLQFESTVRFLAVSGEELGMLGSSHYASDAREKGANIIAVINGDMLGYPTTADSNAFVIGSYSAPNRLVDSALLYNLRYAIGARLSGFVASSAGSDYGPFALAGYDALEVAEATPNDIWSGKDPYYHKPTDTADKLNRNLLRKAGQLIVATAAELARPVALQVLVRNDGQVPRDFALLQNYPNPFNPNTAISYRLPVVSVVSLRICDVLGREVGILVNGVKNAGEHTAIWDGGKMPSGVYFYQLQAQPMEGANATEFSQIRTMLLIK